MNLFFILRILGNLLVGLSLTMVVPLILSWFYQEYTEMFVFGSLSLIAFAIGMTFSFLRSKNPKLHIRNGLVIVVGCWSVFSLWGALPYYFLNLLDFTDAFFESTSGFTTTGATVFKDIESLSHGILFWRALTQWLGGMGMIVLTVAIIPLLGVNSLLLYRAEAPGGSSDRLKPRLQATSEILWITYFLLTISCIFLYHIFGMNWFDSICHGLTTLSTGGFSTLNYSLGGFQSARIEWVAIVFMLMGSISFSLHYRLFAQRQIKQFFKNQEFTFYILIIICAFVMIFLNLSVQETSSHELIRSSLFQVVSLISTTGYVTENFELWPYFSQCILLGLFFIGGCGGSTAGGIKVIRIYILIKVAANQVVQVLHVQRIYSLKVGKITVKEEMIGKTVGFFILYLLLFLFASLMLTVFGYDLVTAFSAVATSLGNVGPGFGEVGVLDNFSGIQSCAKWVLIFCMIAGRLELFTILVLFSRFFWKR